MDFDMTIKDNPIKLLKAIQEHSITYQEHKYEMCIILDALCIVITLRQKDEELLIDYTTCFKSARDVLTSQIRGPIRLTKYLQATVNNILLVF